MKELLICLCMLTMLSTLTSCASGIQERVFTGTYSFTGLAQPITLAFNKDECTIDMFGTTIQTNYQILDGKFVLEDSVSVMISENPVNLRDALTYDSTNDRFAISIGKLDHIEQTTIYLSAGENTSDVRFAYTNGNVYEGQLQNGVRHGQAVFLWANGQKYVGEYTDGKLTGYGKVYDADGQLIYEGKLVDGQAQ